MVKAAKKPSPEVTLRVDGPDLLSQFVFSWEVLTAPTPGETRFLAVVVRHVDPTNKHDEFYIKQQMGERGTSGRLTAPLDKTAPGSERAVLILAVDSRCAPILKESMDSDQPQLNIPCPSADQWAVVSDTIDVTTN